MGGEAADALGQLVDGVEQLVVGHGARHEADALGLLGVHVASREADLEGPGGADGPGEGVAQAELDRSEPVVDAGRPPVRGLGGEADVGAQGQAHAAADGRAVDRGDDRLGQAAHDRDQVAEVLHGPDGETGQREAVGAGRDAGVLEVEARAEAGAGAGQDHDPGVVVLARLAEGVAQRRHGVERHGVHAIGPVQGELAHVRARLGHLEEARHGAGRYPPTPTGSVSRSAPA